ncbi:DUF2075 domain-containing protein [Streptomyces sp. HUAS 31]|uniref:DNA/RNA helicase domain-containing protein n=1 Tax=Streptomyces TaxID=1883 RepID=UPI0023057817|nr:DNA/RNA helicase domain-containing protein [Streptomyces sp. HUAS 31]WCE00389.1 DUF2075 domain-containing protein [Streptomyces sp. HUAS 31]
MTSPMGEFLPFDEALPWLRLMVRLEGRSLPPGPVSARTLVREALRFVEVPDPDVGQIAENPDRALVRPEEWPGRLRPHPARVLVEVMRARAPEWAGVPDGGETTPLVRLLIQALSRFTEQRTTLGEVREMAVEELAARLFDWGLQDNAGLLAWEGAMFARDYVTVCIAQCLLQWMRRLTEVGASIGDEEPLVPASWTAQDAEFEETYRAWLRRPIEGGHVRLLDLLDSYWPLRAEEMDSGSTIPALDLLDAAPRVLLTGRPGTGKSTVLRRLAAENIRADGSGGGADYVPFLLSVQDLERWAQRLGEARVAHLGMMAAQPDGWVERVLRSGRGLLLVDVVEQFVSDWSIFQLPSLLRDLMADLPQVRCVLAVRTAELPEGRLTDLEFIRFELLPMSPAEVAETARRWFRASGRVDPQSSGTDAPGLLAELRRHDGLAELMRTPLLCHVVCAQYFERRDRFSSELHHVLDGLVDAIVEQRSTQLTVPLDSIRRWLGAIALGAVTHGSGRLAYAEAMAAVNEEAGSGTEPSQPLEEMLHQVIHWAGLVTQSGHGDIEFHQPVLRDHLAARLLGQDERRWQLIGPLADAGRHGVIRAAIAYAAAASTSRYVFVIVRHGDSLPHSSRQLAVYALAAQAANSVDRLADALDAGLASRLRRYLPTPGDVSATDVTYALTEDPGLVPDPDDIVNGRAAAVLLMPATQARGPEPVPRPDSAGTPRVVPLRLPDGLRPLPLGAQDLAIALSVATRIEPELIRAVRLRVFPGADAGDEADLWFGDWIGGRTPSAISLRVDLLPVLRQELRQRLLAAEPGDPLHSIGEIVDELHVGISPALRLEEKVNWLDVTEGISTTETGARLLESAVRALVTQDNRQGLADWLTGAWNRLPERVRASTTAWQLVTAAAGRAPDAGLRPVPAPPALTRDDVAVIVDLFRDVPLPLAREGAYLHFGVQQTGAADSRVWAIPVPDTDPRVVEVVVEDSDGIPGAPLTVTVPPGGTSTVPVGLGAVLLRGARGDVYRLEEVRSGSGTAAASEEDLRVDQVGLDDSRQLLVGTARQWLSTLRPGSASLFQDAYGHCLGAEPATAEAHRWRRYAERTARVLLGCGLAGVRMIMGHSLPVTGGFGEVVLAGTSPATGADAFVVLVVREEEELGPSDGPLLCTASPGGGRLDPAAAAAVTAARLERDFPDTAASGIQTAIWIASDHRLILESLHETLDLIGADLTRRPVSFGPGQEDALGDFLRRRLARQTTGAPEAVVLASPVKARARPADLLDADGTLHLPAYADLDLLDEQLATIRRWLDSASPDQWGRASIMVVSGGPGTGKSTLALALVDELRDTSLRATYTSCSPPFLAALRSRAGQARPNDEISDSGMLYARGRLPVIICDDAQQLGAWRPGSELLEGRPHRLSALADYSARLVLFVDESRALLPAEPVPSQGSMRRSMRLETPLRFRFSTRHGDWVTRLLDGRPTRQGRRSVFRAEGVHIAPTVEALEAFLARRWMEGKEVVLTAGHFGGLSIRIGAWQRPWRPGDGSGPRLTEADSWCHVASAHDVDGLEYDWCGVIMGPDLVWRGDSWVTDPGANRDLRDLREGSHSRERAAGDKLIRNAYRCLFTRPSQGLVIFSVDAETSEYLATVAQPLAG